MYQAVQNATQRHVAIKVLRDGALAGPAEVTRFEREVRFMGRLDHPNVVGILDCGVSDGRHYLVMEYIRGRPLDAHVNAERLGVRQILELFATICEAVSAAHVRGIIHRDLKPSNIRVDEQGRPHVLDFGLARSIWAESGPDGGPAGAPTMTGQFVGSLPWASPEQAQGATDRIDVRSDVYSLGVVLHQLLTGSFPYSMEGPVPDVLARIIGQEPARPSAAAGWRSTEDRIGDELDTVVLKCLAKPPERRYQSAGELGADVRRFLAGEPIDAKRDSTTYIVRKLLHRHRAAVGAAGAIVVMLGAGLATSLVLWRTSEGHRKQAEANLSKADAAAADAKEQARVAKQEAQRAERVTKLLQDIFNASDPMTGGDRTLSAPEMLRRGGDRTLAQLNDEPLTQAALLLALGEIHKHLGDLERARDLLARSLALRLKHQPSWGRGIAEIALALGAADIEAGDLVAAEAHNRVAYEAVRDDFRDKDWHVVETLVQTMRARQDYKGVETLLAAELPRLRSRGVGPMVLVQWLNNLGQAFEEQDRHGEAIAPMREALELTRNLPDHWLDARWGVQNNLAWLLTQTGEHDEALRLGVEVLESRTKRLPPDHLDVASSMLVVGAAKLGLGDLPGAALLLGESLRIRSIKLAPTDDRVVQARLLVDECARRTSGAP